MAYNERFDTRIEETADERLLEPQLPHDGKRILKLERGLYVIRERQSWNDGAAHLPHGPHRQR